ncbi:MAG: rod-binding protein [Desulfovibrio sp.]|jgi:Rod binding domain-containing protein|nr:rod-binding protein [Desulfovibrio sp.]
MAVTIAPMLPPGSSPSDVDHRDIRARLAGVGDLRGKRMTPEQKEKKLREACEGFESIFIQKMWQEMRNTLPKEGLLHSREEKYWQDMYDQELAKKMSSAGGIGLASMMYSQLSRNLVSASRSSADAATGGGFVPSAAPFMDAPAERADTVDASKKTAEASPRPLTNASRSMPQYQDIYENAVIDGVVRPQDATGSAQQAGQFVAAGTAAGQTGPVAVEEPSPVEVEEALAFLRQQVQGRDAAKAAAPVHVQTHTVTTHQSSGMEMARMAKQEIGTKLAPGGVRPPLYPRSSKQDGAQQGLQADGQQYRKVRHSTNVPQKGRKSRSDEIIKTLNQQRTQPEGAATAAAAPVGDAMSPAAQPSGAVAQPSAATMQQGTQPAQTAPSQNGSIPPLTATAAKG